MFSLVTYKFSTNQEFCFQCASCITKRRERVKLLLIHLFFILFLFFYYYIRVHLTVNKFNMVKPNSIQSFLFYLEKGKEGLDVLLDFYHFEM